MTQDGIHLMDLRRGCQGSQYLCYALSHMVTNFTCGHTCHLWSHKSRQLTFPGKSNFPGIHIFQEFIFPEVIFPGNFHFPGSQISKESTFSGKVMILYFPGCQISTEVIFPGKLQFPGSHIYREVTITGKSHVPGIPQSPSVNKQPQFDEDCQNLTIG